MNTLPDKTTKEENSVVESLVRKLGLDRRKKYSEHMGYLVTTAHGTMPCTGCTVSGDYGEMGASFGCSECGYTGKRRTIWPEPVTINGEMVKIKEAWQAFKAGER